MSTEEEKTLINPFVFPSEVSFYFILMIIAICAPALSLAFSFTKFFIYPSIEIPSSWHFLITIPFFSFILLPLLTMAFYYRDVKHKIRKYCANRFDEKYPEMFKLIDHECQKMGIKNPTLCYVDNDELNALAFGTRNRPYMLISRGLCKSVTTFPAVAETILDHELAHLKNKDLIQHEIAEALWKSFALVSTASSIFVLAAGYDSIRFWLTLTVFIYFIPFLIIFYLNNIIQRWREIYADVRTIAIQNTSRHLITALRLLHSIPRSDLTTKLLSPFILTPIIRIKFLKQDVFKQVVERGTICAALSIGSWLSAIFSLIVLWDIAGSTQLYLFVGFTWIAVTFFLITVVLLPYWAYTAKQIKNNRQHLINAFFTPFKISLILMAPTIAVLLIIAGEFDFLVYLFILTYVFLLIHQLSFHLILSFALLKAKTKIFLSEAILLLFPLAFSLYLLNLTDYFFYLSVIIIIVIWVGTLSILVIRHSKCPRCGKNVEIFGLFKCPFCLNKLNEDFLIYLKN